MPLQALRSLLRAPVFTATAVAALAFGIGVNTAIFSAFNSVLRPSFLDDPNQIAVVGVEYARRGVTAAPASIGGLLDARVARHLFSRVVVQDWTNFGYTPAGGGLAERVVAGRVSPGWFETFGARPLRGRTFRDGEDVPGNHRVVVLSHGLWQRRFGGEPGAIGQRMVLNGDSYEVVGVMPPEFRWPASAELWCPWEMRPGLLETQPRLAGGFTTYARLRAGVTRRQAETELEAVAQRAYSPRERELVRDSGRRVRVLSFVEFQTARAKVQPAPLAGAVLFVLLIACANVAGLMLARGANRAREMAVRSALGASRWQLMKPLLAESLLIAAAGTAAGLAFAWALLHVLVAVSPPRDFPERVLHFDVWVLGFTVAAGMVSGIIFGTLPAWQTTRQLGRFQPRQRARSILVVAEVALALVLLVGAGLFLRSIRNLQSTEAGFDTHGLMTADLQIPVKPAGPGEPERIALFHRAVMERLQATPGVSHAAAASSYPMLGGESRHAFSVPGRDSAGDPFYDRMAGNIGGLARIVTPGYFATLGVPLLAGRAFDGTETEAGERVLIADEGLAVRYFGSPVAAIGQYLLFGGKRQARIVGVAPRVRQTEPGLDIGRPLFYLPMFATPVPYGAYLVRGAGDLGMAVRQAVHAVDPTLAVFNAQPLDERLRVLLAPRRIAAWLLAFFAGAAVFLAALGLYGVISYAVSQRTSEIGIRMTLGARPADVVRLIMADGLRLALIGAMLGLAGAVVVARALARQLYRTGPFDPVAFAGMAALLLAVAALASWLPARRAARVDPLVALRRE